MIMKWIVGISLTIGMLAYNNSAHADGWNAAEHDYHVKMCSKRQKQRARTTDTPNCQNYNGGTAYSCCCDICDDYLRECLNMKLSKETCAGIKTKCEHDCNGFLSNEYPTK
jgi:hypothetical protein